MNRLWNYFDGEPFLDNPSLYVLNRAARRRTHRAISKGATKMRRSYRQRDARGRYLSNAPRKTRKRKRTVYAKAPRKGRRRARSGGVKAVYRNVRKVAISNPRRKARRRYRRNPAFTLGGLFSQKNLRTVGFTVVGIAGTPFVEGFINNLVVKTIGVTDPTLSKVLNYGVKIGSAYGVSFVVQQVAGREAGRLAFVGGLAYVAVSAIRDFFPALLGTGVGHQPLLGRYSASNVSSFITARAPARLRPETRF